MYRDIWITLSVGLGLIVILMGGLAERDPTGMAEHAVWAGLGGLSVWTVWRVLQHRDRAELRALTDTLMRVGRGDFSPPALPGKGGSTTALRHTVSDMIAGLAQRETDLPRQMQSLSESVDRFKTCAGIASDLLWETDAKGRVTFLSGRFPANPVPDAQIVIGGALKPLLPPDLSACASISPERRQIRDLTLRYETTDGAERLCRIDAQARFDPEGRFLGYRGVGRDVTATFADACTPDKDGRDPLTGLGTATLAMERATEALKRRRLSDDPVAVFHIDLDHFRTVTKPLDDGHVSDLIAAVAHRLETVIGPGATLARVGEDAFVIVEPACPRADGAETIANALLRALRDPFDIAGSTISLTASIGIAVTENRPHAADLLRDAKIAMQRAKDKGRDTARFHKAAMNAAWTHRQSIAQDLDQALTKGALEVMYQPQVDPRNGRLIAFEAHQRWPRDGHGLVLPRDYVPVAEDAGLILPVMMALVGSACKAAAVWPGLSVVVPLHGRFLLHDRLIAVISDALRSAGLPGRQLELLIGEESCLADEDAAAFQIDALDELGVRVTLDRFGAGVSPLGTITRLPISAIRFDERLVRGLHAESNKYIFIRYLSNLLHSQNIAVQADGVASDREAAILADLGCVRVQGPAYGKPLTLLRCKALLRTHGLLQDVEAIPLL